MYAFFEKTCLVQLATDSDESFIVDPLSPDLGGLDALAAPFADPGVVKVFHGADFDVSSLRRDFKFEFNTIFDTMVAAMILGDEKLSLRDNVSRYFDVQLEKAYTRCNWGHRPLGEEQLEYSYLDVAFLVELMDIHHQRLVEADLLEEAQIEFERLSHRESSPRSFNPHGWAKIKGARKLSPLEQSVLAELYAVRDQHSRKQDRPEFKVVGNDTLARLARSMPTSANQIRSTKGISSYAGGRMARDLLAAVARGRERAMPLPIPRTKPDPARRLDQPGQKRLGRLREWRAATSEDAGRTTLAILPNYAMFAVARARPRTREDLAAIPGVGEKRSHEWGEAILRLLG